MNNHDCPHCDEIRECYNELVRKHMRRKCFYDPMYECWVAVDNSGWIMPARDEAEAYELLKDHDSLPL